MDSPEEERNTAEDMNADVYKDTQEASRINVDYMLSKCKQNEVWSHCAALDPYLPCTLCCIQYLFSLLGLHR